MTFEANSVEEMEAYDTMVEQLGELHERAERGARLMDRYRPDWFMTVDTEILQMTSGNACIVGQVVRPQDVYPTPPPDTTWEDMDIDFGEKACWLEETYDGVPEDGPDFEVYYGFNIFGDSTYGRTWHWMALQKAWKLQINARRLALQIQEAIA